MNAPNKKTSVFNTFSARQTGGTGQKVWDNLVYQVVRKKLTDGMPYQARGSYVYTVGSGWETRVLRDDPAVTVAESAAELEKALGDQDINTIMVGAGTGLVREKVIEICERHAQAKTIFYERESHE